MRILTPGNVAKEDMFTYISEKLNELRKEIKKTNKDKKKVKLMNEFVILDGIRKELEREKIVEKLVVVKTAPTTPIQEKTKKERPVFELNKDERLMYNYLLENIENGSVKMSIDDCRRILEYPRASGSDFVQLFKKLQNDLAEKTDITFCFVKEYVIGEKNIKIINVFTIFIFEKTEEQLKELNN